DAFYSALERLLYVGPAAQAAAELDRDLHAIADRAQHGQVLARFAERAVQVHHVQPARALGGEAAGALGGIFGVGGFGVGAALLQAHHAPLAQVDGGIDREVAHSLRKFSSSVAPQRWLFSGWAWMPRTLPRRTTLQKVSP